MATKSASSVEICQKNNIIIWVIIAKFTLEKTKRHDEHLILLLENCINGTNDIMECCNNNICSGLSIIDHVTVVYYLKQTSIIFSRD